MSYQWRKRPDTGRYEIFGPDPRPWKNQGPNGFRKTSRAQTRKLVKEEAAALYESHAKEAFHGPRRGDRKFAQIAEAYLEFEQRHPAQIDRVVAIVAALGDVIARTIDDETIAALKKKLIKKANPSPATLRALIITPLRAVLNFGHRRKWCDKPNFELPRQRKGRTVIVTPEQAQHLIDHASAHQRDIITWLCCIGSRVEETLNLTWDWNHPEGGVDLAGGRARIMQKSKRIAEGRRERIVELPPRIIAMLAQMPHREGRIFQWQTTVATKRLEPRPGQHHAAGRVVRQGTYAVKAKGGGGQLKTGFNAALKRAGLRGLGITPHTLRHSWASWHYAVFKDLLYLKTEGGWETLSMVERYTHLMPMGHAAQILQFWGYSAALGAEPAQEIHTRITRERESARNYASNPLG